jgi:flagellar hook assembly protein FlgD
VAQNYPNPFNPSTTISYSLPTPAAVSLSIYDVLGQIVYQQDLKNKMAGTHTLTWQGTNGQGDRVGSGVYFYKIITRDKAGETRSATRKMILIR